MPPQKLAVLGTSTNSLQVMEETNSPSIVGELADAMERVDKDHLAELLTRFDLQREIFETSKKRWIDVAMLRPTAANVYLGCALIKANDKDIEMGVGIMDENETRAIIKYGEYVNSRVVTGVIWSHNATIAQTVVVEGENEGTIRAVMHCLVYSYKLADDNVDEGVLVKRMLEAFEWQDVSVESMP